MLQNVESDLGLHCLVYRMFYWNLNKSNKKKIIKRTWTGSIDMWEIPFGLNGITQFSNLVHEFECMMSQT